MENNHEIAHNGKGEVVTEKGETSKQKGTHNTRKTKGRNEKTLGHKHKATISMARKRNSGESVFHLKRRKRGKTSEQKQINKNGDTIGSMLESVYPQNPLKRFKCLECNSQFTRKDHLNRHKKLFHGGKTSSSILLKHTLP